MVTISNDAFFAFPHALTFSERYSPDYPQIKAHRDYLVMSRVKALASVGVEPTTFALLARRSNRLSKPALTLLQKKLCVARGI